MKKYQNFYLNTFSFFFLVVKFSIYLNRRVFIIVSQFYWETSVTYDQYIIKSFVLTDHILSITIIAIFKYLLASIGLISAISSVE